LAKTFLSLPSTDPFSVANAFFKTKYIHDSQLDNAPQDVYNRTSSEELPETDSDTETKFIQDQDIPNITPSPMDKALTPSKFLEEFIHVIQFCHLCTKGKITPVFYTLTTSLDIQAWFTSLLSTIHLEKKTTPKQPHSLDTDESSYDAQSTSPDHKVSRKDHFFINTMLKLHDTMDRSILKQNKDKAERKPGFTCLEQHREKLILNSSAIQNPANAPTEFFTSFLIKNANPKAKEMMTHRYHLDKVAFKPNATFITDLWNGDFFWILPYSPSGVSIFFCPETKSLNASELEKEWNFAMEDEIKAGEIRKLSKQKFYLPPNIMDMV
jgi:hypothetical protein